MAKTEEPRTVKSIAVRSRVNMDALGKGGTDQNGNTRFSQVAAFEFYSKISRDAYNWTIGIFTTWYDRVEAEVYQTALRCANGDEELAKELRYNKELKKRDSHGFNLNQAYKDAEAIHGKGNLFKGKGYENLFTYAVTGKTKNVKEYPKWVFEYLETESRVQWSETLPGQIGRTTADYISTQYQGQVIPTARIIYTTAITHAIAAITLFYAVRSGSRQLPAGTPKPRNRPRGFPKFKRWNQDGNFSLLVNSNVFFPEPHKSSGKTRHVIHMAPLGTIRIDKNAHARIRKELQNDGKLGLLASFTQEGNQWYVSILINQPLTRQMPLSKRQQQIRKKAVPVLGIDLGIKDIIITSDGRKLINPSKDQTSNTELTEGEKNRSKRLRKLILEESIIQSRTDKLKPKRGQKASQQYRAEQRKLSRIRKKKNDLWEHIRKEYISDIIHSADTIKMETLKVQNMSRKVKPKPDPENEGQHLPNGQAAKRGLNRELSNAALGMIATGIQQKATVAEKTVIKVPTFFPSTKTCSKCGNVKEKMSLSERVYNCEACGHTQDRDMNAAENIKNWEPPTEPEKM